MNQTTLNQSKTTVSAGADPKGGFRSAQNLLSYLDLEPGCSPYALSTRNNHPFHVTRSFASRMRRADWYDPLLLQIIPREDENLEIEGFSDDPVGDKRAQVAPHLVHKYRHRALLLTSNFCFANCRFCFRRNHPFDTTGARFLCESDWEWLRIHTDIHELILSGGDPLALDNRGLRDLLNQVEKLPQIHTVRLHTRAPIFEPGRVDRELVETLMGAAKNHALVVVLHVNHANELDTDCAGAIANLRQSGAMVLQQGVLLQGVNDSFEAQFKLIQRLGAVGVLPYYLHQVDRARGTAHFEVPVEKGIRIINLLRREMPGYLVPRYVQENAGDDSKTLLA